MSTTGLTRHIAGAAPQLKARTAGFRRPHDLVRSGRAPAPTG
jgi:hypothetical protein